MFKKTLLTTVMTLGLTISAEAADKWKIIHAGTLLADAREEAKKEQTIVVKNKQIISVSDGYLSASQVDGAENPEIIDLKDQYVMPGLIDTHTHILGQQEKNSREKRVTRSSQYLTLMGVEFGMRTLRAGFTTIRNVGGDRNAIFAYRDAVNADLTMGPRIKASGQGISPTGGHGDSSNGFRDDVFAEPHSGICDGIESCRRAVRTQIKYGADHIKYVATGGVLSKTATGTGQQFTDEEQVALVQAAHAMGRKVAAHAHGRIGLEAALRAGVDSIEHGSYLDEGTADLFVETGAYLVPTLIAGYTVERIAIERPGFFIAPVAKKALEVGPVMKKALKLAYDKGVKIAFGTDAGVNDHGTNGYELVLMKQAGMPERAILESATVNAADLMDLTDVTGTIEVGKEADIIASKADPLKDIGTLMNPTFVMARGTQIDLSVPRPAMFPWPEGY